MVGVVNPLPLHRKERCAGLVASLPHTAAMSLEWFAWRRLVRCSPFVAALLLAYVGAVQDWWQREAVEYAFRRAGQLTEWVLTPLFEAIRDAVPGDE